MVGSANLPTNTAESTLDGTNMDISTIPDFGDAIHGNCLVTVNETTIISFGGRSNSRRIALLTIGNSEWQVRKKYTIWVRQSTLSLPSVCKGSSHSTERGSLSGCGLVTRPDGSQFAMVVGGRDSESTSEILDLNTMELSDGK